MPIYEYECWNCGEKLEFRRSMADNDSEIKCPKCEAPNPCRILSMFSTGAS